MLDGEKLTIAMKWERDGQTYIHYIKDAFVTQLQTNMAPGGPIRYTIDLVSTGTDIYEAFTDTGNLDFDFEETIEDLLKRAQKKIKKRGK